MTAVPHAALTVTEGKEMLSKYEWNTKIAQHYFCSRCGIYTFHSKRMLPDHYGVNVYCLEGFDPSQVPVRRTDGLGLTVGDAQSAAGVARAARHPKMSRHPRESGDPVCRGSSVLSPAPAFTQLAFAGMTAPEDLAI